MYIMTASRKRKGPGSALAAAPAFLQRERAIYRSLTSPEKIQRFLDDEILYNKEPHGETCYSPRLVLKHRVGHCMEGAMLAAAALRRLGFPPLLVDLEAERDDDHVIAVYQRHGCWGSIAKSNYSGIRSREPVYRTIRELAMSYFEHYFNLDGEKTLRGYSQPTSLERFDDLEWMTTTKEVWEIPTYLMNIRHFPLVTRRTLRVVSRMDPRLFEAGKMGMVC